MTANKLIKMLQKLEPNTEMYRYEGGEVIPVNILAKGSLVTNHGTTESDPVFQGEDDDFYSAECGGQIIGTAVYLY